jgi:hypothetical protein
LFYGHETVATTGVAKVLRATAWPPPIDIRVRALALLSGALGETDDRLREEAFRLVSYIADGDGAIEADPVGPGVPVMQRSAPAGELTQAAAFIASRESGDAIPTN